MAQTRRVVPWIWARTWPLPPGIGVDEGLQEVSPPGEVCSSLPPQYPQEYLASKHPHQSELFLLSSPPHALDLPPLRCWPPLRGALLWPLRARGMLGSGVQGRGVRARGAGGARPATRQPVRGADTWAGGGGRHSPRAPPSSRGAPPCPSGFRARPKLNGSPGRRVPARRTPLHAHVTRTTRPRGLRAQLRRARGTLGVVVHSRDAQSRRRSGGTTHPQCLAAPSFSPTPSRLPSC